MPTQAEIGRHLFISARRVRELLGEGVLPRGADLDESRRCYILWLRERVTGRSLAGGDGVLNPAEEKARLDRARTEQIELTLARERGELVPLELVADTVGRVFGELRARLRALPTKLAPRVMGAKRIPVARDLLAGGIDESLRALSAESVGDALGDRDHFAAAAEAHSQPVGRRKAKAKPRGKR